MPSPTFRWGRWPSEARSEGATGPFTPSYQRISRALVDEYTITFDQSVPSYAGIPAGDDLVAAVEIGTLGPFIDDDLSVFETDIDKLATAGITYGCNPPTNDRFCPDGFVTSGQLAAFFHRALG